ncbi:hypothetical protein D3C72_1728690 [compost metagenome]
MADERFLHIGTVIQGQLVDQLLGQGIGVGAGFAAVLVIAFQVASDNGFGHGLATRAAEQPVLAEYHGGEVAAGGNGQGAVVARRGAGHGVLSLFAGEFIAGKARPHRNAFAAFLRERALPAMKAIHFSRCSAPCSASSPSCRVAPCSTFSSSNNRQTCASWLPSTSTKRRPSTLSLSWPM